MPGFIAQPQTLLAIGPNRSFGGVSGYVTITEAATDEIEITKQPVQQGAPISDHAFKKPVRFSAQITFAFSLFSSLSSMYQKLQDLQSSFTPFTVTTPKRTYNNMLMAVLGQTTDKKTENCLAINVTFEQVILVPIGLINLSPSQLKNAASNAGTQSTGKVSAIYTAVTAFGG